MMPTCSHSETKYDIRYDSTEYNSIASIIYFTDLSETADPLLLEQKSLIQIGGINFNQFESDSITLFYHMPNRAGGNIWLTFPKEELQNRMPFYYNKLAETLLCQIANQDPTYKTLSILNSLFAVYMYGEEAEEESFFGINFFGVINRYVESCRTNSESDGETIEEYVYNLYKEDVEKYHLKDPIFSKKIITTVEAYCE